MVAVNSSIYTRNTKPETRNQPKEGLFWLNLFYTVKSKAIASEEFCFVFWREPICVSLNQPNYKKRYIIKAGQQLTYIEARDINYFYSEEGLVYARIQNGKKHVLDYTLDQLEDQTDPTKFFRINRKLIIRINAIDKIHTYFNSRLKLELNPRINFEAIVSRDRVPDFKKWLDH